MRPMSPTLLLILPLLACQSSDQKLSPESEPASVERFVRELAALEQAAAPAPAPVVASTLADDEPQGEARGASGFDHGHSTWDGLLAEHVKGGLMDYRGLAEDRAQLDRYLAELAAVTPTQAAEWEADERFAFYANAYNAHVAKLILDAYPLKSINDLSTEEERVWDRRFIPLGAHLEAGRETISLDELENAILRPRFEDPRVHVAVNCASVGCPPLDSQAIKARGFDAQLDRLMREFLGDGVRNQFDEDERTVRLSQIFNWFRGDFEQGDGSLLDYLRRYGPAGDAAWLGNAAMEFLDYDWSLNDVPQK